MPTSASILRRVWASFFSLSLSAAVCLSGGVETSSPHLRTERNQQVVLNIISISTRLWLNISLSWLLFTPLHLKVCISNFLQKCNCSFTRDLLSQTVSRCVKWAKGRGQTALLGFQNCWRNLWPYCSGETLTLRSHFLLLLLEFCPFRTILKHNLLRKRNNKKTHYDCL